MSGFISHDPSGSDRSRNFPDPVRGLCGVSDCHPFRCAGVVLLARASGRQTGAGIAAAGRDQLRAARTVLRRAAGFDLRSRAYRKRQADSRSREMSEPRVLSDAPWLRSGPAARVLVLLNGDGEEARVIGGAVRNALLKIPLGDIDIAT